MKSLLLISIPLILLILTAGCLDDLSSTLPPCCDGTCDGVKTSVITTERHGYQDNSGYVGYIRDADNILYTWSMPGFGNGPEKFDPYNNHNVTFSYEMVNGHRHITGIIEDHDAKSVCNCCNCCQCKCNEEWERVGDHWESTSCGHASKMWNETSTNGEFITPASVSSDYQCVQKCCGCEGK